MSKSFRYVSDFQFPSECGFSGSAGKTSVKGYYRGGNVGKTKDVIRNEREELNRVEAKRRDAGQEIKRVKSEMRYDKAELRGNKSGPKMLKKGGAARAEAKIGKVMGEYKEGKLHSGSKTGPKVANRKQAVAIALSEARNAGAKIPAKKAGGYFDRRMMEGASSRPTDARGRTISIDDLNRSNRDVGGMSAEQMRAARDAVARGNRMQAEEAKESRLTRRAKGGYMGGGACRKK